LKKPALLYFCFTLFYSCAEQKSSKYALPQNATQLIASDSMKVWKIAKRYNNGNRMNMGHCFLAYKLIFNIDKTMRDNNEENSNCGKSIKGDWELTETEMGHYLKLSSPLIPELLNTTDSFKLFKILEMSDSLMIWTYSHKQFSNNSTTIKDYYIPENAHVKNRDFHY